MQDKKFLTVMAVFDDKTQALLTDVQNRIIEKAGEGTLTMGIPFHLTLGSYPTNSVDEVVEQVKRVAEKTCEFPIDLVGYNSFGNAVFFLEPSESDELLALRKSFENDFAHGFAWVPHTTLFCGDEEQVRAAKQNAPGLDFPIKASIVAIELGEFFPAKKIIREQLKGVNR
ncbi:MAG: 2'-5' RNA ligase family protein [Clostridia bacterium]|nr:2'-5' RNA ligase family protein [Clostridia bacterium]